MLKSYKISGGSMLPNFQNGERVLSEKLSYWFREPRVGEVVILKYPGKNINLIKRITKKLNGHYLVQGDSSGNYLVSRKQILARVCQN